MQFVDPNDNSKVVLIGDKVDANDKPFNSQFPFVAKPTQPFPPGSGAADKTRQ